MEVECRKCRPEMSCPAIDQGEYVYDWKKTRSDHMHCEFVESPRSDLACQCNEPEDGAFTRVAASPT
ncbi:hypothetical protein DB728_12725 [Rhizobium leguminosarum bv. viciae USDA 2370]|nr:hypothetical protein DB728_12725 [Rhizobium leguminosarum bv. viciae USDA 2370]TBZ50708.1 hypothetical protein E0H42_20930 [Rhizobium leguminosarum bv. viciae]TBZ72378.1 hypothetical protein E0H43_16650 [Rhizobium leguminosarum bv. viciae]